MAMGPPSPPLALSPAFLAMLQARQAPSAASGPAMAASPPAAVERPTPTSSTTGRGRLVDILV
jgi:hypothetical protein